MFAVDEPTIAAIRRAHEASGELGGVVEFRRHFPLISDPAKAHECVRIIMSWKPLPPSTRAPPREGVTLDPTTERMT